MKLCVRIVEDKRGGYMAACPSLPGCICRADTRDEARVRLGQAIEGYIAAVNNFVPENITQQLVEA